MVSAEAFQGPFCRHFGVGGRINKCIVVIGRDVGINFMKIETEIALHGYGLNVFGQ